MKEDKEKFNSKEVEVGEDATKYGEFVSSYFAWITLPEQKENAKRLQNITKKEENNVDKSKKNEEKDRNSEEKYIK